MQISRRNALVGASAAAVVAGAPMAAQADDAHLEALHADWRAAEAIWLEADLIAAEAEFAARRTCGPCPLDDLDNLSGEAVRAAIHSTPAWEAEREAAVERSGAGTLRRRTDAAHDAERVAFGRFMEAPSQTPRGLYLKFEAGIDEGHWLDGAGLQFDENVMQRAIRRDLERLAGGMPS